MNSQQISERTAKALNLNLDQLAKTNEGKEGFNEHNMREAWDANIKGIETFVQTYGTGTKQS